MLSPSPHKHSMCLCGQGKNLPAPSPEELTQAASRVLDKAAQISEPKMRPNQQTHPLFPQNYHAFCIVYPVFSFVSLSENTEFELCELPLLSFFTAYPGRQKTGRHAALFFSFSTDPLPVPGQKTTAPAAGPAAPPPWPAPGYRPPAGAGSSPPAPGRSARIPGRF